MRLVGLNTVLITEPTTSDAIYILKIYLEKTLKVPECIDEIVLIIDSPQNQQTVPRNSSGTKVSSIRGTEL